MMYLVPPYLSAEEALRRGVSGDARSKIGTDDDILGEELK